MIKENAQSLILTTLGYTCVVHMFVVLSYETFEIKNNIEIGNVERKN